MLNVQYDGKEIPFEGRLQNPDYLAFLEKCQEERERTEERGWAKLNARSAFLSAVIAVVAAGAAVWTVVEAHLTRVNDERPFLAVDVHKETVQNAQFGSNDHPISIDVVAFGKSPSLNMHGSCETFHVPISDKRSFSSTGKEFSTSYLLPSRMTSLICPYVITGKESDSDRDPLRIIGYVEYSDDSMWKKDYATPFCYDVGTLRGEFTVVPCSVESAGLPKLK